jgi:putative transposase
MEVDIPRTPRFNLPGVPQHVVQRGNNRDPVFMQSTIIFDISMSYTMRQKITRLRYMLTLLMSNHVHLLVTLAEAFGITHLMQDMG